jgi:hypothetical protein
MMLDESNKRSYCLIKGSFDPEDARQILMVLVNDKINFHQRNDWSRRERFGETDPAETKRIEELQQTKADIAELIEYVTDSGLNLTINCNIEVLLEPG